MRPRASREPTADARALARVVRDNVDAMVSEGFTEEAALRFIAVYMGALSRPPKDPQ